MIRLLSNSWWMLVVRGAAAVIFGVLAVAWPGIALLFLVALFATYALITGAGGLELIGPIAAYAIAIGVLFIILGLRVRSGMGIPGKPRDAGPAPR